MNYQVVYFTRTGTSRRVAEKIANKLSCKAIEITDDVNWKGALGFIKGGYYATKNKPVNIRLGDSFQESDGLIVVTPLWAGKTTPAIDVFLKTKSLKKVHLVVTSNGSMLNDRSGYKSVTDIVKHKKNEDQMIKNLVDNLQ